MRNFISPIASYERYTAAPLGNKNALSHKQVNYVVIKSTGLLSMNPSMIWIFKKKYYERIEGGNITNGCLGLA